MTLNYRFTQRISYRVFLELVLKKITGNTIYLNYMNKGDRVKIEVTVDFDSYCMMEVDYYANKK